MKNLSCVITIFCLFSLLLATNLVHPLFGQDNPAADIIKKLQENLEKFEKKSLTSVDTPTTQKAPAPSPSPLPKPKADFTNSNFAVLISKPNSYLDATVDITGEVSNFPEPGLLQMYVGGDVNTDTVVHYNDTFVFVQNDCVKILGVVEDQFVGENMFLATRIVPSISARTIDKVDCLQAINPAEKTVIIEKSQEKAGIEVTFHKVEFSDKNTRVYLTVDNMNPRTSIGFYDFDANAIQGKRQYSTTYSFDVEYPQIKSQIPPGIEENGVILFEPLDYKTQTSARFQFEATRQDTYDSFNFVFLVRIPR